MAFSISLITLIKDWKILNKNQIFYLKLFLQIDLKMSLLNHFDHHSNVFSDYSLIQINRDNNYYSQLLKSHIIVKHRL